MTLLKSIEIIPFTNQTSQYKEYKTYRNRIG